MANIWRFSPSDILPTRAAQSASLAKVGGKLFQQTTYVNGNPYAFQSNLPVLGGYATGTYPSAGPMMLQVNVSGQGAAQQSLELAKAGLLLY